MDLLLTGVIATSFGAGERYSPAKTLRKIRDNSVSRRGIKASRADRAGQGNNTKVMSLDQMPEIPGIDLMWQDKNSDGTGTVLTVRWHIRQVWFHLDLYWRTA